MYLAAISKDLLLAKSCKLDKQNNLVDPSDATDLAYLVSFHDCVLVRSNYRNPLTAAFRRSTDGCIAFDDLPERYCGDAALAFLAKCSRWRQADKKPRRMHPNSLKNLKPLSKGCKALARHYRAPVELGEKAKELRDSGLSFRAIGDALGVKANQVAYLIQGAPSKARANALNAEATTAPY